MKKEFMFLFCLFLSSCQTSNITSSKEYPHEGNPNLSYSIEDSSPTDTAIKNTTEIVEDNFLINLYVNINEDKSITFYWDEFTTWEGNENNRKYIFYKVNKNGYEKDVEVDYLQTSYTYPDYYGLLYVDTKIKVCACIKEDNGLINILASSNFIDFPTYN